MHHIQLSPQWRIYYDDGSVWCGRNAEAWHEAPEIGVQVVVLMEAPDRPGWTYRQDGQNVPVKDRKLWTGESEYDPFGWGVKIGTWMDWDEYMDIWAKACSD